MRALKADHRLAAEGHDTHLKTHALPKPMRLAIRFMMRLARGDVHMPRHIGIATAAGFLFATAGYGAWVGGHVPGLVEETSTRAGLSVDSIRITGHERTTQDDVLKALEFGARPTVVALDVEAARQNLLALPWVTSASVAKAFPGSVSVEIVEKHAAAIWQNGTDVVVLDEKGAVIGPARLAGDRALPAFVGLGADKTGLAFAQAVRSAAPAIADRVRVHIRVADRRWDLLMDNGVTVKLPEQRVEQALLELDQMQAESDVLARDVTQIDLRIAGRTTLALGEAALAALFPAKEEGKTQ